MILVAGIALSLPSIVAQTVVACSCLSIAGSQWCVPSIATGRGWLRAPWQLSAQTCQMQRPLRPFDLHFHQIQIAGPLRLFVS